MHQILPARLKPGVTYDSIAAPASATSAEDATSTAVIRGNALIFWDLKVPGKKKKLVDLWTDVITVLNKADGSYVRTIDVQQNIVDLNVWNGRLAVATPLGVHFLSLD